MKVKNLLKKVGSVITTAALLATLGTTAFADDVISSSGKVGGAITAPEVHAEEVTPGSGIYNLVVKCKTTAANKTGMTMLIYKIADNTDADINNPGYYDGETTSDKKKMQIVGIDQIAKVDGSAATDGKDVVFGKELNSEDTTKTSIRISTNANGSSDNYYVPMGKKVLIAVSGDQCTPAYALLEFTGTATSATCTLGSATNPVQIKANESIDDVLNDRASKDEAVFFNGSQEIGTKSLANVDFSGVNWSKSETDENVYTATVTLSNGDVPGVKIDKPITLSLTATVEITPVDAKMIKSLDGVSVNTEGSFDLTYAADGEVTKDKVTEFLVGKKVVVTDETSKVDSAEITLNKGMLTEPTSFTDSDDDYTVEYGVTILNGTGSGNEKLNISSDITATVKVKVTKKAVVNKIELKGDPISVEVTKGTNDDATIALIKEALEEKITKNNTYSFEVTPSKGDAVTVAISDAPHEWTAEKKSDGTFVAKLKVSKINDTNVTAVMPTGGVFVTLPTITITVNEKSEVVYGDIAVDAATGTTDGAVMMDDVGLAFQSAMGTATLEAWQVERADVAIDDSTGKPDGAVMMDDVGLMFMKAMGTLDKFPVEK